MSTQQDAQRLLQERRGRQQREERANRTLEFVLVLLTSILVGRGFFIQGKQHRRRCSI